MGDTAAGAAQRRPSALSLTGAAMTVTPTPSVSSLFVENKNHENQK